MTSLLHNQLQQANRSLDNAAAALTAARNSAPGACRDLLGQAEGILIDAAVRAGNIAEHVAELAKHASQV